MVQTSIFDKQPFPPSPFKPGSQNHRLYEELKGGPVTNARIIQQYGIFNSTGRCSEIRAFLKPHGIALHCERVHDGLFEYSLKG